MCSENTQNQRLAWWRIARFGMFIHWGLYAVPAGEWKGQTMPGIAEWLQGQYRIPLAEYRELAKQFHPVDFNADSIVKLAHDSGMRYIVITAKHHDGFAMWDSKVSDYTIAKATPFGRDPLKELAESCARTGIRLGFYYSQDLDWEHPDGAYNTWDYEEKSKNFQRYLDQKVKPQLRELLTNYGPVALIWCDTPVTISCRQARELKEFICGIQPDCLLSGRIGHGMGDYGSLGDNQLPAGPLSGDWETPATINHTWGFKKSDQNWRSSSLLLRSLADLASKGVNYLLNIGPDALGVVPRECAERLHEIGGWLRVNGEAIYGTKASPFKIDFDWGRITCTDTKMFLIFDRTPGKEFILYGLLSKVWGAYRLSDGTSIPFLQSMPEKNCPARLCLQCGDPAEGEPAVLPVIALELAEPPQVQREIFQMPDARIVLPAHLAVIEISADSRGKVKPASPNLNFAAVRVEEANLTEPDHIGISKGGLIEKWRNKMDWVRWEFTPHEDGEYAVRVYSVAAKYQPWVGGHRVAVRLAGQEVEQTLTADEVSESPRTTLFAERATIAGTVAIPANRKCCLELRALVINPDDSAGLCISKVELRKIFAE